MNSSADRLLNLFGALAIGVADRVRRDALDATSLGGEASAALVVIGHASGMSIDQLGRVLGLSHPGTVRLVDRLVNAGLALRETASHDRRAVALKLTKPGHTHRRALLKRREKTLQAALDVVSEEDRAVLERIANDMLQTLPHDAISALSVCRFCNERKCPDCPMDTFGTVVHQGISD